MDPRIGMMNNGKFYAFVHGPDEPETVGTVEEVEIALGIRQSLAAQANVQGSSEPVSRNLWNVKLTFQFPAWDEGGGIDYADIEANSKSEANRIARKLAERDGHLGSGKGRATFTATEAKVEATLSVRV